MFEPLVIQSHKGPYTATFDEQAFDHLNRAVPRQAHFVIDDRVAELYASELSNVLASPSVLRIEAAEANKSLDRFSDYVEHLVSREARRGQILFAIGGGIIQDITCFLSATLLRGLRWHFYPTTLLAQADSCIGSKSSINVGKLKNVLGTFTPPVQITIGTRVLATLNERDVRSGVGEMLKVHAIDGPKSFDEIAADYWRILRDPAVMVRYIHRSLEIKKAIIEQDEFDVGLRNVMNYGHSFGHAVESATNFAVPHGIAVTMGMDMANYTAMRLNLMGRHHYDRMHPTLAVNYSGFGDLEVPLGAFLAAIARDKKNTSSKLAMILPDAEGRLSPGFCANDSTFRAICADYLRRERYI